MSADAAKMLTKLKVEERTGFREVLQTPEKKKIDRHLQACKKCKKECGCPLGVDITSALKLSKEGKFEEAKSQITEINPFISICSRLCSAPCQDSCSRKIKVKSVLRFLADKIEIENSQKVQTKNQSIAVVGGGIAGLLASYSLIKKGYKITLFEARTELGGFVNFKIPEFRLPKDSLEKDLRHILSLDRLELRTGTVVGHAFGVQKLKEMFNAVLICTGANKPALMHIPGETLLNVDTAHEFLSGWGNEKHGEEIFVIGGGNSAIDAARLARRLGANVTVMYRRSINEMPADKEMVKHADEEGVRFLFLTRPVRILGQSKAEAIECEQMMLGEKDFDERKRPIPIGESEFQLPCDRVIIAVGAEPNPSIGKTRTVRSIGKERIWVDSDCMTSIPGIFAAGDIVKNGKDVMSTMKNALEAAEKIDLYLDKKTG